MKKTFEKKKSYLRDITNILKKIRYMKYSLISRYYIYIFKNADKEQLMYLYSDKTEIMINDKADKFIKKTFGSLFF